jgi:hypothetical protein
MIKKLLNKSHSRFEKGSALLVSLMIMVGLSLLGLGFVAMSETESSIATNEMNYVQAQSAAEIGAKTVIEMFQDASWANRNAMLPKNDNDFKTVRTVSGASGSTTDTYKENSSMLLFDTPFKGPDIDKFYGDINSADVWINDNVRGGSPGANSKAKTYLDNLSAIIFPAAQGNEKLRISDIRVYAPPVLNGTKVGGQTPDNGTGFWVGENRYGVATIRVTAQKLVSGKVRAERSVKAVIAETPFPTVDGAIETSGSLVGSGSFQVFWGKVLSEKDLDLKRPAVGLPWFDAKNAIPIEYGYDSVEEFTTGRAYRTGELVHAPAQAMQDFPELTKLAFRASCSNAGGCSDASLPVTSVWPKTIGGTWVDGSNTWTAEAGREFNFDSTDIYKKYGWLWQLLGVTLDDPWLHARSRGNITFNNAKDYPCGSKVLPHPCDYADPADTPTLPVTTRYSNFFQLQITTDSGSKPERYEAVFPTMDYQFWKSVASSSANTPESGIYYFRYADDATQCTATQVKTLNSQTIKYQGPGGAVKDITEWLNAAPDSTGKPANGLGPGFYFFDTCNGKNPQFGKGGTLTPDVIISSSVSKSTFQMQGYVYLNSNTFGSTGEGNLAVDDLYALPAEPYRDVGFYYVDTTTTPFQYQTTGGALPTGNFVIHGAGNNAWDYQELNDNGQFDIWVQNIAVMPDGTPRKRPDNTDLPDPTYAPIPWYPGCNVPDTTKSPVVVPAKPCSEPHEPFLNIIYPLNTGSAKDREKPLTIGWGPNPDNTYNDAEAAKWRRPKARTGVNTSLPCLAATSNADCTSNAYDSPGGGGGGALVTIDPILYGAMYNEGGYNAGGNARYYGALLMRGDFVGNGTPDVFFDECLATGCLEKQLKMQRVMITSMETDTTQ